MYLTPDQCEWVLKSLVMLKISPLLLHEVLRVANSMMLPVSKCPAYLWPWNLTRISVPLANQIMFTLTRLIGG